MKSGPEMKVRQRSDPCRKGTSSAWTKLRVKNSVSSGHSWGQSNSATCKRRKEFCAFDPFPVTTTVGNRRTFWMEMQIELPTCLSCSRSDSSRRLLISRFSSAATRGGWKFSASSCQCSLMNLFKALHAACLVPLSSTGVAIIWAS